MATDNQLRIGVCTSITEVDYVPATIDYVELSLGELAIKSARELVNIQNKLPFETINVNRIFPSHIRIFETDKAEMLIWLQSIKRIFKYFDVGVLTIGSGRARRIPPGLGLEDAEYKFREIILRILELTQGSKTKVCIEPLSLDETNFCTTVYSTVYFLQRHLHSYPVFLTIDPVHTYFTNYKFPPTEHKTLYKHMHISDRLHNRITPKSEEVFRFLKWIRGIGYKGGISIECTWKDINVEIPMSISTIRSWIEME